MKENMKAEPFLLRNSVCRKNKGDLVPLNIEQISNKLQQHKAAIETFHKNGSGLAGNDDFDRFIIVNPILSYTNGDINAACSGPLDTSLANTNMDEFNNKNKVGEVTKNNDISSNEQERESEIFCETLEKGKIPWAHAPIKLLKMLKLKKNCR